MRRRPAQGKVIVTIRVRKEPSTVTRKFYELDENLISELDRAAAAVGAKPSDVLEAVLQAHLFGTTPADAPKVGHTKDCTCSECHYGRPMAFRIPGVLPPSAPPSEYGCPAELRGLGWREEDGYWEPAWRAIIEGRDRFHPMPAELRDKMAKHFGSRGRCLHCDNVLSPGHLYYCGPRCSDAAALKEQFSS